MQRVSAEARPSERDRALTIYEQFIKEHFAWAMKNLEFIQSVNTPEKARAYVDAHIDD